MIKKEQDDQEYYDRLAWVAIGIAAVTVFIIIFLNSYNWRGLL